MNCPACSSVLRPIQYEGTELHSCDGCGGEFVGPEALAHVVNTRDARPAPKAPAKPVAAKPRKPGAAGSPPPVRLPVPGVAQDDPIRKLACAACGSGTTAITYALDTGVRVDRCGVCGGVWLDKDELEHIQEIMETAQDAAPGKISGAAAELARARQKAHVAGTGVFQGSRFSFVNAIVNRFLDAA